MTWSAGNGHRYRLTKLRAGPWRRGRPFGETFWAVPGRNRHGGTSAALNVRHGIVVVENLRLGEIARAHVREFLLVISHAKLRGATGAWVAPLAIV
jgi:hypothetical protein